MRIPRAIQNLIEAFERLPGIGPKTAQRLTFYLLHVPQEELDLLSSAVSELKRKTIICSECYNVGESNPCEVCRASDRDQSIICVVENPLDVLAMERAGYKGLYHVLHGVIDPLNNIGPDEIYVKELIKRVDEANGVKEIILATNPNMEGEATAMYIARAIRERGRDDIKITRIGRGLPVGGDLEYADDQTLRRALEGRRHF